MNYQNQKLSYEIHITDDNQNFPDGSKIKKIIGARSTANIKTFGGTNSNEANVTIWGLNRDDISTITQFSMWNGGRSFNKLVIKANDSVIYEGTIMNCVADFNQAPDISVNISCLPCAFLNVINAKPFSYNGDVKASEVIESIIKPFGMSLTNIDVDDFISSPFLQGTPYQQILQVVEHIRCFVSFSYTDVYISKFGTPRDNSELLLSPETGLIGYPVYFNSYLTVKTYFNPSYKSWQKIILKTHLPLASGSYTIGAINHNLSCELPGGQFESNLILYKAVNEKSN